MGRKAYQQQSPYPLSGALSEAREPSYACDILQGSNRQVREGYGREHT